MNLPLPTPDSRLSNTRRRAAFSLVEVALALGIVSFALVGLLGLLPLGLSTSHKAADNSTTSQIAQRLIDEAQQTDFDRLTANPQTFRYFNEQGDELPNNTGALYDTNLVIVPATVLPGAVSNPNLATVYLQVATNPGNRPLASGTDKHWSTPVGVTISCYAANVARNE